MATVRSKPLASVSVAAITTTTLFTVPAGRTAIVRYVTVAQTAGALINQFTVRATVAGITQPFWIVSPGSPGVAVITPYIVLAPGDSMEVITTQTGSSRCAVYGALLLGVAA
jgi:hypothetical protein